MRVQEGVEVAAGVLRERARVCATVGIVQLKIHIVRERHACTHTHTYTHSPHTYSTNTRTPIHATQATRLYVAQAETMQGKGKLKEAEKLYCAAKLPNLAISMYKAAGNYDDVMRLVSTVGCCCCCMRGCLTGLAVCYLLVGWL